MKLFILIFTCILSSTLSYSQDKISAQHIALAEQYLDSQKELSGMFIMASKGEIVFRHGYGFSDKANKFPFSDKTLYTIGSITKPFTATAILLLQERNLLTTTQTLDQFFENVPNDKKKITIHQLLTHSAGFPGAIGDDYEAISTIDFQKKAWNSPLVFAAGHSYEYSNVGYSLLGMIVEKISGMSYSEFLEKNIFTPAGMQTAGYTNADADYSNLAHGYLPDGQDSGTSREKNWNGAEPYWNLKANGGLLMSALDMYQWYMALRGNKILKPETLKLQTTPHVDEGGGSFYGYGYAVDGESVQHNGGNRIYKADFRWFPGEDFFFFSASNDANVKLFRLNDEVIKILKTGQLPVDKKWEAIRFENLAKDPRHPALKSFINLLKDYSQAGAISFAKQYATKGLIERNGQEELVRVFEMLSLDSNGDEMPVIKVSGPYVMLQYKGERPNTLLKVELTFLDGKVDKLGAMMDNM